MQPRTVINKNTGNYRTANKILESTGQLQKYRNLQDRWDHWFDLCIDTRETELAGVVFRRRRCCGRPPRRTGPRCRRCFHCLRTPSRPCRAPPPPWALPQRHRARWHTGVWVEEACCRQHLRDTCWPCRWRRRRADRRAFLDRPYNRISSRDLDLRRPSVSFVVLLNQSVRTLECYLVNAVVFEHSGQHLTFNPDCLRVALQHLSRTQRLSCSFAWITTKTFHLTLYVYAVC